MAEPLAVVDTLDTIGANSGAIPKGTRRVLAYITGSGGIPWSSADIAALAKKGVQLVARIDQTNSVLALSSYAVLIKDIEPGASTNLTADHEAAQRARLGLRTTLYCMGSDFEPLKVSVANLGIQAHVDYIVADWNLDRNGAIAFLEHHPEVVGVQYASPTSNPHTLVPGSNRTLAEANIDLSITRSSWPALPAKPKRRVVVKVKRAPAKVRAVAKKAAPHPKVAAGGIAGVLTAALVTYLNSHGVAVTHLNAQDQEIIVLASTLLAAWAKGGPTAGA